MAFVLQSHHHNARIQHTIESATAIDGAELLRTTAASVFRDVVGEQRGEWGRPARDLYRQLGLGDLDVSRLPSGRVEATSSHIAEGWNAGLARRSVPACTLTDAYLTAAHHAATGEHVRYRETACLVAGAPRCVFERTPADGTFPALGWRVPPGPAMPAPLETNHAGLAAQYGVYLASLPARLYTALCARFVEEKPIHGPRPKPARPPRTHPETPGGQCSRLRPPAPPPPGTSGYSRAGPRARTRHCARA